jgi:GAF domain-containing protein
MTSSPNGRSTSPFGKTLAELLDSLGKLVEKSASVRSIESLLPDLLEAAIKFSGMTSAAIYLTGDAGEVLHLMAEKGEESLTKERRPRLLVGEAATGRAYQSRKMILVENDGDESVLGEQIRQLGMKSQISLPLISDGQILGVLDLNDKEPHRFTEEETAWLQSFAGHIAVLLFGSRLFVQSQAANIQLTRLYDFGGRIIAATTFPQALELTAQFALMATTAHSAIVYLIDPEGHVTLNYGVDNASQEITGEVSPRPEGLIREICTSGVPKVLLADDIGTQAENELLRSKGIITLVGLPLKIRSQAIGVLFVRYSLPHTFSQAELDGLTLYAVQAAGTIERLRLLEESRQRESDLRMIIDMARVVTSTLDLEELLQQIAVLLVWTARMDACVLASVALRRRADHSALGGRQTARPGQTLLPAERPDLLGHGTPATAGACRTGCAGAGQRPALRERTAAENSGRDAARYRVGPFRIVAGGHHPRHPPGTNRPRGAVRQRQRNAAAGRPGARRLPPRIRTVRAFGMDLAAGLAHRAADRNSTHGSNPPSVLHSRRPGGSVVAIGRPDLARGVVGGSAPGDRRPAIGLPFDG